MIIIVMTMIMIMIKVLPCKHFLTKMTQISAFFLPSSNTGASQPYDIRALPSDCWTEHSPPRTAYLAPGIS